ASRSMATTFAPSWANRSAVARPMPPAAPGMTMTLPSNLRSMRLVSMRGVCWRNLPGWADGHESGGDVCPDQLPEADGLAEAVDAGIAQVLEGEAFACRQFAHHVGDNDFAADRLGGDGARTED